MYHVRNCIVSIKNGLVRNKSYVKVKKTRLVLLFLESLYKYGYINSFKIIKKDIIIVLKYFGTRSCIRELRIISTGSNRVYKSFKDLKRDSVLNNYYIVSTNKGIVSTRDYKFFSTFEGGYVICRIM